MLYIRATFVPALVLILLTAVVSAVLFAVKITPEIRYSAESSDYAAEIYGLETVFGHTIIPWIFAASAVLLTVLLCIPGTSFGSQTAYTMGRLRVSEKSTFLWQAGYNALVYFLLWAVGAAVLSGMCMWYETAVTTSTNQSVFLALYRDEFLHSMLPLHDISRIIRNLSICIALGVMAANYTYKQRNGKASYGIIPMLIYVLRAFPDKMGSLPGDIIGSVICLFFSGLIITMVLTDQMSFLFEEEETTWTR